MAGRARRLASEQSLENDAISVAGDQFISRAKHAAPPIDCSSITSLRFIHLGRFLSPSSLAAPRARACHLFFFSPRFLLIMESLAKTGIAVDRFEVTPKDDFEEQGGATHFVAHHSSQQVPSKNDSVPVSFLLREMSLISFEWLS